MGQIKLGQRLHIRHIEGIGQILEAHEDLVITQREESITASVGHTLAELLGELEELLISLLVGNLLLDGALVVECEEVIQWLLNIKLLLPLKRWTLGRVMDVHVVSGGNANAKAILVGLVDSGARTILVLHEDTPLLHELNGGWAGEVGRATLWPVIQDSHLQARVLREITHSDGGIDWVVVSADVLVREATWKNLLILLDHGGVVEDLSRDHFEAVGVGPEFALRVEAIEHLEVNGDILTLVVLDRNGVEFNVEFDESLHMLREQNLDERALLVALVVGDGPLFDHVTLLIHNIGIDLTELLWEWRLEFGKEDESTFAPFHLKLDFSSFVDVALANVIYVEHLMCQVLLEVDSKHLREVLLLVGVLEEDLRLVIDTLDL